VSHDRQLPAPNSSRLFWPSIPATERTEPLMLNNFCVNLTRSTDDPDRATVAMVVANAAVASGKQTMVFLSSEGIRLAMKGVADQISEEGFQPMATLLQNFLAAGGSVWVCSPCFKKRGYTDGDLIEGATIVGGAKLVEFLSNDGTGVSY
jgi:predicted peroxiredoxin